MFSLTVLTHGRFSWEVLSVFGLSVSTLRKGTRGVTTLSLFLLTLKAGFPLLLPSLIFGPSMTEQVGVTWVYLKVDRRHMYAQHDHENKLQALLFHPHKKERCGFQSNGFYSATPPGLALPLRHLLTSRYHPGVSSVQL